MEIHRTAFQIQKNERLRKKISARTLVNPGILRRQGGKYNTFHWNLHTVNFYFALFIRLLSSVNTEQYRVGVMS